MMLILYTKNNEQKENPFENISKTTIYIIYFNV